ncbi:flagellar assembly protein FlgT [Marinomonas ostreistagni]|uniref:flagellar assembly protein FlgT n=1 Tax=Marinomonas ostreistagni TaxID=359209 RepID=UPI0019516F63|nr:flagellar assembly protein FlgT [Marinomonas ostreistagni]MBM6552166.1 flagella assembly protein FlgT [Marinomonas ostreistagni]
MLKILLSSALLVLSSVALSQVIEAQGEAVIYDNDIDDARYRATQQAIKQATLQASARVRSNDLLSNTSVDSKMSMQSAGRANNVKLINERIIHDDLLAVTIRTNITPESMCDNGTLNPYIKSVGVTGFALQKVQQARLGGLDNIGRELPKSFAAEINRQGYLRALTSTNLRIYPDLINAPTSTNNDGSLTDVARIGEELGVQYVVSGVIRDISEVYEQHPDQKTPLNSLIGWANKEDGQRIFDIDLYMYDGFSGALIFQHNYREVGNWDINETRKVGFGSPRFWSTHYGKVVAQTLRSMALDASEDLNCQPFVANIFRTEGTKIYINAGATSGLKKGDQFQVYRRYEIFDQLQNAQTQLNNANINVTITQVQPNFAIGELAVEARILNVQQQDVVIAW